MCDAIYFVIGVNKQALVTCSLDICLPAGLVNFLLIRSLILIYSLFFIPD